MAKFVFGTDWFRVVTRGKGPHYFVKGQAVKMGQKLPLNPANLAKDLKKVKNYDEASSYVYAVQDGEE